MKEKLFNLFNLQLFTEVANMMASTDEGLSDEMKEFYKTTLLEFAKPKLVFNQFGLKQPMPKRTGQAVEWRRFNKLNKALTPLTEGITPDGHKTTVSNVKAFTHQYGDYTYVTDVLDMTAVDPVIAETTKLHAENAGETLDTLARNELLGTTNVLYARKSNGNKVSARSSLDETCLINLKDISTIKTILKRKNAPQIDGSYVMVVHPDVENDLTSNAKFIELQQYTDNVSKVFEGEIGKLYGIRFVVSSEAPILAPTARTGDDAQKLSVYPCLAFGRNAYGVVQLDGGGMQIIVKPLGSAGTADPLNQRSSIGWKVTGYAAKILNNDYMVSYECLSSEFSRTSEPNDTPTATNLPSWS